MKIATWNLARPTQKNTIAAITEVCRQQRADILVLTEADERIHLPNYPFCCSTTMPKAHELSPYSELISYASTERRVLLYSKYPFAQKYATYDESTALCVALDTSMGELTVYGTIIGVHGNRRASFYRDLEKQLLDIRHLASEGKALCICGDFNCSFGDNYYFTHAGRSSIIKCFQETGIRLITENQTECIDHIAITEEFVCNVKVSVGEWNVDKRMSDHKGIAVEFT